MGRATEISVEGVEGAGGVESIEDAEPEAGTVAHDGRRVIARLADDLLPLLIARLEASSLGELEVREDGWRVRLRRPAGVAESGGPTAAAGLQRNPGRAADSPTAGPEPAPDTRPSTALGRPEDERNLLTSPAVGYFVPRDGIAAGSTVRGGDVIGYIDVLGVRQEVVVPEDAILARVDVEPGQAVEYGQPIARLEPEARG